MHSPGTNSGTKCRWSISDAGPRLGSTKLASIIFRGALILAAISALVLIAARPAQGQTETVLYNFTCGSDGAWPGGGLVSDGAGNFYGMSDGDGVGLCGDGTVFKVSPNGSGGWNQTVIHNFTCGADGCSPMYNSLIFDGLGNLYGATAWGGVHDWGAAFELSPVGTSWTETVLYYFCSEGGGNCTDGGEPEGIVTMDAAGNLYGTTAQGGNPGYGTVFELSPSGSGWTEQVIYNVESYQGCCPQSGVAMDTAGNLFGTTSSIEPYSTVFELSPNGKGGWTPTVIHSFCGRPKDGCDERSPLVLDKAGNLYGTTYSGGAHNGGTVYKLRRGKKGKKWIETILHSFGSRKDGSNPWAGVVLDAAGNIYGTTGGGGKYGVGTVFELVAQVGKSGYKEKVLWSFSGADGSFPIGGVILDSAGNLYGTTQLGGSSGYGVVFEVTP